MKKIIDCEGNANDCGKQSGTRAGPPIHEKVDAFELTMSDPIEKPSAIAGKWAKNLCDTIGIAIPGKAICDRWWYDQVVKGVQSAIDEATEAEERDLTQFENDMKKLVKERPLVCPHCGKGNLTPEPEGGR